jgi:hypothetical protein
MARRPVPIQLGEASLRQQDVERIAIHPVRPETAKPLPRAEIMASRRGFWTV